jgi:hypothetical protein
VGFKWRLFKTTGEEVPTRYLASIHAGIPWEFPISAFHHAAHAAPPAQPRSTQIALSPRLALGVEALSSRQTIGWAEWSLDHRPDPRFCPSFVASKIFARHFELVSVFIAACSGLQVTTPKTLSKLTIA